MRRRSGAGQLNVVTNMEAHQRTVQPPTDMHPAERELFDETVQSMPPGFFVKSDVPLLKNYAQTRACVICYMDALRDDPFNLDFQRLWKRAVRLQTTLETKLRLTPHSRVGPKSTGRQHANPPIQTFSDRVRAGQHTAPDLEPQEDEAS